MPNENGFDLSEMMNLIDVSSKIGKSEIGKNLITKTHSDFTGVRIIHDPTGDDWLTEGSKNNYVRGPYFLDTFNLANVVSNKEKSIKDMTQMLAPLEPKNSAFFNVDAVEQVADTYLHVDPRDLNADLGVQFKIRQMVEQNIIDDNTFVVLSHGHFLAGIDELTKTITADNKYMFDTTIYFPLVNTFESKIATKSQLQLWSEDIGKTKEAYKISGKEGTGGWL